MTQRYKWSKLQWTFFALTATELVMFISIVVCGLLMDFIDSDWQELHYIYNISAVIGLICALLAMIMYLTDALAYIQEKINERLGRTEIDTKITVVNETVEIVSPLKGKAQDNEHLIVEELRRRGRKKDGSLNRAPVAQLLRALQDEHLLQTATLEKGELMQWVCNVTGYRETNVSAFNEAINNATESKVEEARQWVLTLI